MTADDPFWNDSFHVCAFRAWAEIYAETGEWPPNRELTRQRACKLFEDEKRAVDSAKKPR